MLFTSWQSEETDLIRFCSSYQECYMLLSNAISKQMKQYAVCNKDFKKKIQQEMNSLENTYDC